MLWLTVVIIVVLFAGLVYLAFASVPFKMLAIAQAAYRETIRQPLFWLLLVLFTALMGLSVFLPYFTLREDLKMMKDLQLDAVLLPALILTVFKASISISEEIEERTAITVMSKPVSRRQFLLGKFAGILMAAMLLMIILTLFMGWTITYKIDLDGLRTDPQNLSKIADPQEITTMQQTLASWRVPGDLIKAIRYILLVFAEIQEMAPGVVLNFCQVMVLTAVAVALATRLPMILNLVLCLVVFFMGRLTHILEAKSQNALVKFVAQVFDTLLPGLNYYDIGPAIVTDHQVPWIDYVLPAAFHGVIYTAIALLFGLILFEDRDLA